MPRASQRVNMKYLSYNNCTGDGPEYLELAGGPKETPLFHQQMQIWATPVMLNNADKKWALQRNYLDGLVRQQRLQQAIAWLSPSELFDQTTDALCRTDAGSFLKYMESLRKYRENVITYFKDHKLFESTAYLPPSLWTNFLHRQKLTWEEKKYGRNMAEVILNFRIWIPAVFPAMFLNRSHFRLRWVLHWDAYVLCWDW